MNPEHWIDFVLGHPVLMVVAIIGFGVYLWFDNRRNKEFRNAMYDFKSQTEKDHAVNSVKLDHLDECIDGLKQEIREGLVEHIKGQK